VTAVTTKARTKATQPYLRPGLPPLRELVSFFLGQPALLYQCFQTATLGLIPHLALDLGKGCLKLRLFNTQLFRQPLD